MKTDIVNRYFNLPFGKGVQVVINRIKGQRTALYRLTGCLSIHLMFGGRKPFTRGAGYIGGYTLYLDLFSHRAGIHYQIPYQHRPMLQVGLTRNANVVPCPSYEPYGVAKRSVYINQHQIA